MFVPILRPERASNHIEVSSKPSHSLYWGGEHTQTSATMDLMKTLFQVPEKDFGKVYLKIDDI